MTENEIIARGIVAGMAIVLPFLGIALGKWHSWKGWCKFWHMMHKDLQMQNGATGFLPFKVMGHKAVQTDIVGVTGFRYDDVMGSTLIVYMNLDVMRLQSQIYFEFHHVDLGSEYMKIVTNKEFIAKRKEEFGYCIERVINQAMRRMLEKDKE